MRLVLNKYVSKSGSDDSRLRFILIALFLGICVIFGGGGSPAPMPELVVQISALLALAGWLLLASEGRRRAPVDWLLWCCVIAFVAIPLVQLVPLPPSVWHNLPGRETELAALRLVDAGNAWRPITVAPWMTAASALSLIPPVTMIFLVSRLNVRSRIDILAILAALAVLSAIVSVLQVSSGTAHWLYFYQYTHYGFATGFQANRNATADILLVGILALGAFTSVRRELFESLVARALYIGATLLLVLAVILTGSRAGTVLLLVAGVFLLAIFRPKISFSRRTLTMVVAICVVSLGAAVGLHDNAMLQRTWTRYAQKTDARTELWANTRFAIAQYWPVGSGMGTFAPVFVAVEPLEAVDSSWPNRAHDDYLEYTLEAGLAGIFVLLGCTVTLIVRGYSLLHSAAGYRQVTLYLFTLGTITLLGLHSLVDYPMRSMSLAAIAGLAIGLSEKSGIRNPGLSAAARQTGRSEHQGVVGR